MRRSCRSLALASWLALAAAPAYAGSGSVGNTPPGGGVAAGVGVEVVLAPEADPNGSGRAQLLLDTRRGQVCFDIQVEDVDPVVAVHIHAGAVGESNEELLLVDLDFANEGLRGCTKAGRELVRSILENVSSKDPAQFYLHVHSSGFSTGAVRGQLERD